MDAVNKLEGILKLILQGDRSRLDKSGEPKDLRIEDVRNSENTGDLENTRKYVEQVLTSAELVLKLHLNKYETSFNAFIEHIFQQIQNIFHYIITRKTLSAFPLGNLYNIFNLIVEITISHPCDTKLKMLADFYRWNIDEIRLKKNVDHGGICLVIEELSVHLRIISILYEAIYEVKGEMEHNSHNVAELVKCIITDSNECELYAKLACHSCDVLMIQTLIDIIPKFIKYTKCSALFQLVWEEICDMYKTSADVADSKIFTIFCYLSDLYFHVDNKQMMINIFANGIYWVLIQNGLISSDSAVRKQALFLTKTSLNYIIENNISFYCLKKQIETYPGKEGEKFSCKLPLIYWEQGMGFEELNKLCIIVECLEEKQVHIVKPIFVIIEKFLSEAQESKLDASWIFVVIERMLSHDNVQIIRQGITSLMSINISCYCEEHLMARAVKLLVTSLNGTQIYMSDMAMLLGELKIYFESCASHVCGKMFFRTLLREMCNTKWSSEALCAITYCLQSIESEQCWHAEEMNLIKRFLLSGAANHYTYMKCGMQCQLMVAAISLTDTRDISLGDVHNFLNSYDERILQRRTALWESVSKWLRRCYAVEDAQRFIRSALGRKNFGRMLVLLRDSFGECGDFLQEVKSFLKNVSVPFVGIHSRPYCDKQVQDSYLSLICDVMRESCGDAEFCDIFRPFLPDIVIYIKLRLECIRNIGDFQTCKVLSECLQTILIHDAQHLTLSDTVSTWFDEIVKNFVSEGDSKRILPIQEYIQITLVKMIMEYIPCETSIVESYLRTELNAPLVRTSEDLLATKDLQTLWGRMNSEFSMGKWQVLSNISFVSPLKVSQVTESQSFISCCAEALDLSGHAVLFPLMSVIGKALPSLLEEPGLQKLINDIWKMVTERKKNEDYLSLVKEFVEAVFQLEVIQSGNSDIREMLVKFAQHMLSEKATTQTAIVMVEQMQKMGFHEGGMYLLKEVLARSLIFGQVTRKDERLIRELCSVIETSGLCPLMKLSSEVRARSILFVLSLNPEDGIHSRFCDDLFEHLKLMEEERCRNKIRYFSDSHVHRVKQRLLQALLVVEPFMSESGSEKLWNWLLKKILLENNQTSVRYLQEWLILRMIKRNDRFRSEVWAHFEEALDKKPGSLCSFMSVMYHSVRFVPGEEAAAGLIERAVETLLPYCMAQHFSVRLYAQVTLEKLLEEAGNRCLKAVTERYGALRESLSRSLEWGNAAKNCSKLRQNFYFNAFDPVKHYSLQTIFFELPRLAGVSAEEMISERVFRRIGLGAEESIVPLTNGNDALEKSSSGEWAPERQKKGNFALDSGNVEESKMLLNFQKKMVPLKHVTPNEDVLLGSTAYEGRKMPKDGLIVVASLIDRMPNLGGLSRTCEVFGACELVIGSLKYVEDKQFQSLSVTAEKWIVITEVKPFHLTDYLVKMKRNGYTVLAAEQTVNSQSLQSVRFPKKSLLLLGNEKEGIPPTLLPLTDICVEIPQVGVIRSLNVHVTGALFLWEYAKQHCFSCPV